jgi:hypothetical protein
VFAQGIQLAVKDFGLALEALELALTGMVLSGDGRLQGERAGFRPKSGLRVGASLFFQPLQATVEEFEPALHVAGELPFPIAVNCCEGCDGLGESAEIGDEGGHKLGEGATAGPGLGQQTFQGFFGIVVGQSGGTAGIGEQAR